MKLKVGDNVVVTKGKLRGKKGKIVRIFISEQKILVEGLNIIKRHVKAKMRGQKGEIIKVARPLPVANIKLVCPHTGKGTRVGYKISEEKKQRISKKSAKIITNS